MEIVTPGATNLGLFISAAFVLLVVPGPAVLYIFARSVEQGRLAGFISIWASTRRRWCMSPLPRWGLSAILASSALAFSLIKYAGAAYLIWIGLKKIFGRSEAPDPNVTLPAHGYATPVPRRLHRQSSQPQDGTVLSRLPAAVRGGRPRPCGDADRGAGADLRTSLGIVTDGCYALVAGTMGAWLKRSRTYLEVERYVSGVLFIGLGLTAALAGNQKK